MNLKDIIIQKAKQNDSRKVSTISIRVEQSTKDKWKQFCKENNISQQATFEAILTHIMETK